MSSCAASRMRILAGFDGVVSVADFCCMGPKDSMTRPYGVDGWVSTYSL